MIKTESATLDNQLFKFDAEPSALYFFGEAICNGIDEKLKNDESIIDFNRAGIDWRHEYCQKIQRVIEDELEPLISSKKKALSSSEQNEVKKESIRKLVRKLCNKLNECAIEELESLDIATEKPDRELTCLEIRPNIANLQKEKPRAFVVYAPLSLIKDYGKVARITSSNPNIKINHPSSLYADVELKLETSKVYYCQKFEVIGMKEGEKATITATLGEAHATAEVTVARFKPRSKRENMQARKGGFITDIKPDNGSEAGEEQRTRYDNKTGIIWINVNFPSVKNYIQGDFGNLEADEKAKLLLAELVGEAFFRALARRKLENNKPLPGAEIDAFNNEVNKLQKKFLYRIHEVIFKWKFKN
jgi:hypothetical protein